MRKGTSIIGLQVISQSDGAMLGHVKDLIFDHETDKLLALLLSERDLFGLVDAQIVAWDQVLSMGPQAVMVQSAASRIKLGDAPSTKLIMEREHVLAGTRIFTSDGRDLGTFADMFVDETNGHIVGYEVSGGFVSDSMHGKRFLAAPQEINLGQNVAVVPPSVAVQLEQPNEGQPDAARGLVAPAGASDGTNHHQTVGAVVASNLPVPTELGHSNKLQERALAAAIGRPVGRDVYAADGSLMAAQGSLITSDMAEQSRREGRENDLIAAAGSGMAVQGVEQMRDTAHTVWDALKAKASELSGAVQERKIENVQRELQARIDNALGRLVNRVILGCDDQVILNTGDIITHAAVDRAKAAGALDILLSSVYNVEPQINPEMLRVRDPGSAALDSQVTPENGVVQGTGATQVEGKRPDAQPEPGQNGSRAIPMPEAPAVAHEPVASRSG